MKKILLLLILSISCNVSFSREAFAKFFGNGQDIRIIDGKIEKGKDGWSGTYKFVAGIDTGTDVHFRHDSSTEYTRVYKSCKSEGRMLICTDIAILCSAVVIFAIFPNNRVGIQQTRVCEDETRFNSLVQEIGSLLP